MKTKSYVRFSSRAAHLDADIELADVLKISIRAGMLSTAGTQHVFDKVNPQQHPRLPQELIVKQAELSLPIT